MFIRSTGGTSQLLARAWRGVGIKLIALAALLLPLSVAGSTSWAAPATQPASTAAPTFTVNSVSDLVAAAPLDNGICDTVPDNNVCTLRAAIMKANHFPGGATIVFASHAADTTYLLTIPRSGADDETTGDLNITATVTIVGNGAGITIIDGNGGVTNDRVFWIGSGITVTMTGVTIQRGHPTSSGFGGGLVNLGHLTLDHSAVLSNTINTVVLGKGGGIENAGTLTVTDSLIRGNGISSMNLSGGGISGFSGSVALINTTIAGNQADANGGGIDHEGGTLTVDSSTVSGNNTPMNGGGVHNTAPNASFVNTTIISNTASIDGGGLANSGCSVALVNSTVSGNKASGNGGGIWNSVGCGDGGVSLFNVTIADNQADADFNGSGTGGGIYNLDKVQIQNSLVADNSAALFFSHWPDECHGTLTSQDYNLISFMTYDCTLTGGTHDQTNVLAHIGLPQDNGGPTLTNALLPGSPAIDAGNPGGCDDPVGATLASDQRGSPRPANGAGATRCDIGAYELQRLLDLPFVVR